MRIQLSLEHLFQHRAEDRFGDVRGFLKRLWLIFLNDGRSNLFLNCRCRFGFTWYKRSPCIDSSGFERIVSGKSLDGIYTKNLTLSVNGVIINEPIRKSVDVIAKEFTNGNWGNGDDQRNRLTAAGYDYNAVQAKVNELLGQKAAPAASTKKSNDAIAQEVINGKWGNGNDRINRLRAAGFDPNAIQALVNQKLDAGKKSIDTIAERSLLENGVMARIV